MTRDFRRFLIANALNDLGQWIAFSSVTFLVLQAGGVVDVSLVQGAPLVLSAVVAPFLGALVDRLRGERVIVFTSIALALVALGCLRFDLRTYAALMVVHVALVAAFGAGFSKVLPAVAGADPVDRALGRVNVVTGVLKTASLIAGPFFAHRASTWVFLVVAALFGASAALFAALPRSGLADRGHRRAAPPGAAPKAPSLALDPRQRAAVFALWVLTCVCYGTDEAVAMEIAGRHLHVPPQWSGFYPAAAAVGGIAGGLSFARGGVASAGRVVTKIGALLSLRALSAVLLVFVSSKTIGFGLKLAEGALADLVALLAYSSLVLRAPAGRRGRLQGLFAASAALAMLAGKSIAWALGARLQATDIYGGIGLLVAAAAIVLTTHSFARERALRAPRRTPAPTEIE